MMAKAMKILKLHYPMIQFLIKTNMTLNTAIYGAEKMKLIIFW